MELSLPQQAVDTWHHKSQDKAVIDYSFHLMVSELNDKVLGDGGR
ncbi:hypothetical protein MHH52_27450 [Paenibacillus sp. FSL K6-0276]|nr:hypothetical protein [Paenibacillus sp.]